MEKEAYLDSICMPSEDVVVREIDGNVLIIPLVSGIVELEGELFTLNQTGRAIWQKLDGQRTLKDVAALLAGDLAVSATDVESEVVLFANELRRRKLLVIRRACSNPY